jgi:hypothetical protein
MYYFGPKSNILERKGKGTKLGFHRDNGDGVNTANPNCETRVLSLGDPRSLVMEKAGEGRKVFNLEAGNQFHLDPVDERDSWYHGVAPLKKGMSVAVVVRVIPAGNFQVVQHGCIKPKPLHWGKMTALPRSKGKKRKRSEWARDALEEWVQVLDAVKTSVQEFLQQLKDGDSAWSIQLKQSSLKRYV